MKSQSPIRTTEALARALGLSRWTVSRALNGSPGVSAATAARVRNEAARRGFHPNALARGLRSGQSDAVGVILPDPEDYHLGTKLRLLREALEARGRIVVWQVTNGSASGEEEALARFCAMRIFQVVSFASRLDRSAVLESTFAASGGRILAVDPLGNLSGVEVDRAHAMWMAGRHLIECGCRGLCVVGLDPESSYSPQRMKGLRRITRSGMLKKPPLMLFADPRDGVFETGRALGRRYAALGANRPGGVIALSDRVAIMMNAELARHGLTAPVHYRIVGYDASAMAAVANPELTTIDPRPEQVISRVVDELLSNGSLPEKVIRITPRLVIRESTAGGQHAGRRPISQTISATVAR